MKPWQNKLRVLEPYVPGEQSKEKNIIKLNANENPYPPSPRVGNAIKNLDFNKLSLYPDTLSNELIEALALHYKVNKGQIFVGNGSDEVIAFCYMAFFNSDKPILFPDITYSFYPVWCRLFGVPFKTKALDENFKISAQDYYEENGGIILPNPNAPTGIGENKNFITDILEHNKDVIVVIDEAYVDFGGYSCVELLEKYENLVIVHTFSKSRSLAGLRIGSALANPQLISLLNSVKNSFNSYTMDTIAIAAGTASIKDNEYFENTVKRIITSRETFAKSLKNIGFTVYLSQTNFLLVSHPKISAYEIFKACKEENIYIRYFDLPRIDNCLRITIGKDSEMDILKNFLENYIKANT